MGNPSPGQLKVEIKSPQCQTIRQYNCDLTAGSCRIEVGSVVPGLGTATVAKKTDENSTHYEFCGGIFADIPEKAISEKLCLLQGRPEQKLGWLEDCLCQFIGPEKNLLEYAGILTQFKGNSQFSIQHLVAKIRDSAGNFKIGDLQLAADYLVAKEANGMLAEKGRAPMPVQVAKPEEDDKEAYLKSFLDAINRMAQSLKIYYQAGAKNPYSIYKTTIEIFSSS